jgi:hypothetical protein
MIACKLVYFVVCTSCLTFGCSALLKLRPCHQRNSHSAEVRDTHKAPLEVQHLSIAPLPISAGQTHQIETAVVIHKPLDRQKVIVRTSLFKVHTLFWMSIRTFSRLMLDAPSFTGDSVVGRVSVLLRSQIRIVCVQIGRVFRTVRAQRRFVRTESDGLSNVGSWNLLVTTEQHFPFAVQQLSRTVLVGSCLPLFAIVASLHSP